MVFGAFGGPLKMQFVLYQRRALTESRHATRPITLTLVVDDFGVKYMGKQHAEHLIICLKDDTYKLTEDWTGNLYCGILLRWD